MNLSQVHEVNEPSTYENKTGTPQFSLRWLLLFITCVCVYLAWAASIVQGGRKMLDVLMSGNVPGFSALACALFLLIGFGLMVTNISANRADQLWPTLLLLAALGYAGANVGVFVAMMAIDPFAIFNATYIFGVTLVFPAIVLLAVSVVAGFVRRLDWLGVCGIFVWIHCVAFAHLWVIAAASASV